MELVPAELKLKLNTEIKRFVHFQVSLISSLISFMDAFLQEGLTFSDTFRDQGILEPKMHQVHCYVVML